jgi:hypothetical protein
MQRNEEEEEEEEDLKRTRKNNFGLSTHSYLQY